MMVDEERKIKRESSLFFILKFTSGEIRLEPLWVLAVVCKGLKGRAC